MLTPLLKTVVFGTAPVPEPVVAPEIVYVKLGVLHASVTVGAKLVAVAVHKPAVVFMVLFVGHVSVGGVVSTLFTMVVQELVLPSIVAVKVTVNWPVPLTIVPAAGL